MATARLMSGVLCACLLAGGFLVVPASAEPPAAVAAEPEAVAVEPSAAEPEWVRVAAEPLAATGCEAASCSDPQKIYFGNTLSCSKFCQCSWGSALPKDCPQGLHFNKKILTDPKAQICVWPSQTSCSIP